MNALYWWLLLAFLLFCIGAFGVLARRNIILVVMSLELMLNAVNIALVATANFRAGAAGAAGAGTLFALFIIVLAAAEVTVGLAIVIANYRNRRTVQTDQFDGLKG